MHITAKLLRAWAVRLVATLWALFFAVIFAPFLQAWAQELGWFSEPGQKVHVWITWLSRLPSSSQFAWSVGGLLGLATGFTAGVLLDAYVRKKERSSPSSYIDTRLRLRRDPAGTNHYLQEEAHNIHRWHQPVYKMDAEGRRGKVATILYIEAIAITFETPIDYDRPVVEAFGHTLPGYTFFPLGTRGAFFFFNAEVATPVIEIWFPPVGYWDELATLKGEVPAPPSSSDTVQKTQP